MAGNPMKFTPLPGSEGVPSKAFTEQGYEDPREVMQKASEVLQGEPGEIPTKTDEPVKQAGPEIDPEDKQTFVRALLAGQPFSKTYKLFGAKEIRFSTRLVSQTEAIRQVIGLHSFAYPGEREIWQFRMRFLYSVHPDADLVKDFAGYEKWFEQEFAGVNDIELAASMRAFSDFEDLCDLIYTRAQDPDF